MVSKRGKEIKIFMAMEVLERAMELERRGQEIIHLELGEPDFDTPECIKEACIRALREGKTHYTHSLGVPELREAICENYWKLYRVNISPDRIVITSGSSSALLLTFSALLDPGDEVIIPNPYYPCYPNILGYVGAKPVTVDVLEDEGFQYDIERVRHEISPRTKAILINSPSNPTGQVMNAERMAQLAQLSPFIVSDEIYNELIYKGTAHSVLEFTQRAFVINGFSKVYAMTGWRLGYIIVPEEFIRPLQKIQQNLFICPSSLAQWSAIAALKEAEDEIRSMVEMYNKRRLLILRRLKEIGFGIAVEPTGAFYVLANAGKFSDDSYKLAFDLLENAKVGVGPGIDFGSNAEGYLRFCYANSIKNIERAMERITLYLAQRNAQ